MPRFVRLLPLVLAACCLALPALAATLPVQGLLRTAGGGPVADGPYVVFLKLYPAPDAPKAVWDDVLAKVEVQQGLFQLELGASPDKPLPDALLTSGAPLWLGVQVGSDPELPKVPLHAVARAYYAHVAGAGAFAYAAAKTPGGAATGLDCSGCVVAGSLADGSVTSAKVGFAYAGADSKGGPALQAISAQEAQFAQSAKLAEAALKATSADEANGLQCTGCVGLKQLGADVAQGFVSTQGGTVTGDLAVTGALTVGKDLQLGSAAVHGGKLAPVDVAKQACGAPTAGQLAFDAGPARLYFCDGKAWRKLTFCAETCLPASAAACGQPIPDACGDVGVCLGLGTACDAGKQCLGDQCVAIAASCQAALAADAKAASGVYVLDPDGSGGQAPFQAYCDMTSDGGGWTLLLKLDGTKPTFSHDAVHWTSAAPFQAAEVNLDATEHKSAGFASLPFTKLRLQMKAGGATKTLVVDKVAASLLDVFKGPYQATGLGRNTWKSLVNGASLQPSCNAEGYNVAAAGLKIRIGIAANQENDCQSPDSYLGFGTTGADGCSGVKGVTTGNMASCSADNGDVSIPGFGWIWGR